MTASSNDGWAGWLTSAAHRDWLADQARRLLVFFRGIVDDEGRFVELDDDGRPMPTGCPPAESPRQHLLTVARAVHSFALGEILGIPGCGPIVEQGIAALRGDHHDRNHGGYFSATAPGGPVVDTKSAYDHAFVLLAGASAVAAGHGDARTVYDDALAVIDAHFWSDDDGASVEAFTRSWEELEAYRGANSNMHLCEAFLAAAGVDGDVALAERARRIAERLIDGEARAHGWLLPEHYDTSWAPVLAYNADRRDDPFRPYGVTIGHLLEWSRLLVSIWLVEEVRAPWLLEAARELFARAVGAGWDTVNGGLVYTVGWDARPVNDDHYWWPVAEGIAASSYLARVTGEVDYERWYRRFWDFAATHLVDHRRGGWYAQLDRSNRRTVNPWYGKPDVYHALQACVLPTFPPAPSAAAAVLGGVGP